jgi:hypothetical protein
MESQASSSNGATQIAMEALSDTPLDAASKAASPSECGGLESLDVTDSSHSNPQGPELSTEGYDKDAHARVVPPASFSITLLSQSIYLGAYSTAVTLYT